MAWTIDNSHSEVGFNVRHMMISTVRGSFHKFSGAVDFNEADPVASKVDVTIDVTSVDTRDEKRDGHLKSPDFFDAEKFPSMTFKSTKVEKTSDTTGKLHGELTIKGVTKPVTLTVTHFHSMPHPMLKKDAIGANASTKVKRSEFNMGKNVPYVGDEITLTIAVEAIKE